MVSIGQRSTRQNRKTVLGVERDRDRDRERERERERERAYYQIFRTNHI